MLNRLKCTLSDIWYASIGTFLSFAKVSFIVGSHASFFSVNQCVAGLMGRYGGTRTSSWCFILRTALKCLLLGQCSLTLLLYHIPSFFQSLYWSIVPSETHNSRYGRLVTTILSIACMALFLAHPVGGKAQIYSAFWLIPAIVPHLRINSLFLHALTGTLLAHALGTVLWIYTHSTTPALWLGLLPITCAERILFALGTTALIKIVDAISSFIFIAARTSTIRTPNR